MIRMKKLSILLVALTLAATAFGQAQMDLRLALKKREVADALKLNVKSPVAAERISVLADVEEDAIAEINTFARVGAYAGGIAVVDLKVSDLQRLCDTKGVKYLQSSRPVHACMDKARAMSNIDDVHQGTDLPQGYDGTGVVYGTVDMGFDPNHIAFTDDEGRSRVKAYIALDQSTKKHYVLTSPEEISQVTTEYKSHGHATYTTAAAAGRHFSNNFGGVAPGADIVMATFKDTLIQDPENTILMNAIKLALDEMKKTGKPYVLNLSLGFNLGAHDGSDPVCRFLGGLAHDNIICVAAGNEGDQNIIMTNQFDGKNDAYVLCQLMENGIELWSGTDKPFDLKVMFCNKSTREVIPIFTIDGPTEETIVESTDDTEIGRKLRSLYAKPIKLSIASSVKTQNDCYCVEIAFTVPNKTDEDEKAIQEWFDAGNCIVLQMNGEEGQLVNGSMKENEDRAFHDATALLEEWGVENAVPATITSNGTINIMCLDDDIISVGAYNSNASEIGDISAFSSWCDFPNDFKRPHLVAPGSMVCAANSRYTTEVTIDTTAVVIDGITYPYISDEGTSIACPIVSGSVALWLQANPELTPQDVLAIIKKTCVTNEFYDRDDNKARWGAGMLNTYAGIKESLSMPTSIVDATDTSTMPLVKVLDNKQLEVTVAAGRPCRVKVYSVDGRMIGMAESRDNSVRLPMTSIAGTYIVNVNGRSIKMMVQ